MACSHFSVTATDGAARTGILHTPHGSVPTPVFMPVGTAGSVKAVAPDDLTTIGAPIVLGNTYHLYLRPGDRRIDELGGLHRFAALPGAVLTDSGGFQVFSLNSLCKVREEGVEFRSHLDGSKHFFTPEGVIDIQRNLRSDIMMVLDECLPFGTDRAATTKSLERTARWAERSRRAYPAGAGENLLFGIVQGGCFKDLREISIARTCAVDFDGFAIGGLSVGESKAMLHDLCAHSAALLPAERPRYLMGVGTPLDLLLATEAGVDMFDCVMPTRNARNGTLFTSQGKVSIKRREFADDDRPLDPLCRCYACRTFSRAYLRHLFVSGEPLALRLNSLHNLTYYVDLMAAARKAIETGTFTDLLERTAAVYNQEAQDAGFHVPRPAEKVLSLDPVPGRP
ncbi:MAG: tRNA guanosine(34) transglycosylase Tgt [Desulfovibrio sp.]|jgi:queuine tRNA-ribosyltransferase|nr:tRNA guanosine(34) transglycosylase Tgt [Desulfovibrio sp.]